MTRHSRPYCYTCRRAMRAPAEHLSTASHRRTVTRNARETSPGGSHAYSARRAGARQAYQSLARWDEQYSEDDPGNSPEWDAEQAR